MIILYTPKEIAEKLKVHYETVLDWIKLGKLNAYQLGRGFRISEGDLFDFLEASRYKSFWKGKLNK